MLDHPPGYYLRSIIAALDAQAEQRLLVADATAILLKGLPDPEGDDPRLDEDGVLWVVTGERPDLRVHALEVADDMLDVDSRRAVHADDLTWPGEMPPGIKVGDRVKFLHFDDTGAGTVSETHTASNGRVFATIAGDDGLNYGRWLDDVTVIPADPLDDEPPDEPAGGPSVVYYGTDDAVREAERAERLEQEVTKLEIEREFWLERYKALLYPGVLADATFACSAKVLNDTLRLKGIIQ